MAQMSKKAIIIIAAVAVLVIAGCITAYFFTRDLGAVAVVNGVKITKIKLEEQMEDAIAQYEAQGMILEPDQIAEVRSTMVDKLVTREVLLQVSESYEPTAEELETQIASFKDRFDSEEAFTEALTMQGYDMVRFTKVIGEDLRIQKMIEDRVPEETIVTDDDMMAFFNENPSYFTQPERVHASHILVNMENTATDEEKALALKKIKEIEQELKYGADFAELAKLKSEGPSGPNGGDLGEFTRGQMVGEFETIAFALPEGKISGIVETQFGYHIIKLHTRYPESSVPFEEVKAEINKYLFDEKSSNKLNDFLESLKEEANIRIPEYKPESLTETPEQA